MERKHDCKADSNKQLVSHMWKGRDGKRIVVSTYRCRKCGKRWEE